MMVERKDGLIVNVSSPGGLRYLFNVVYGVGKAAVDRMAADCAVELKKDNVTMISLWPGPVKTEYVEENVLNKSKGTSRPLEHLISLVTGALGLLKMPF
jgi:short-subunit dehydrogenase